EPERFIINPYHHKVGLNTYSINCQYALPPKISGCHGANFGAKKGGGYYAYITNKFSNRLIVVDPDPNGDGDLSDAEIAGAVTLVADHRVPKDDKISSLAGFGGQGIVALPNVYNGWVQNLNSQWSAGLTDQQRNPVQ
ncbi:MAG TPA: hypothetical protein PK667_12035, partial [Nitrosomonas europaea]|nr:hypothetical protein [Nitrosomonas europaea]